MLHAMSVALDSANTEGVLRASHSYERQGFFSPVQFDWEGGHLSLWHRQSVANSEHSLVREVDACVACVGPLWLNKRFDVQALTYILREWQTPQDIKPSDLHGNFSLFIYKRGQAWLMNDALGLVRIYCSADGCYYSTSWLATCAYTGTVTLNAAAATEYILLGAVHSWETVTNEVTVVPRGQIIDLERHKISPGDAHRLSVGGARFTSIDETIECLGAHLRELFSEIADAFPGHIKAALSGGFDSRLILAGLLQAGLRPQSFVYGSPETSDVEVAQAIAEAEGIELEVIDKTILNQHYPNPDVHELVRSALFFDGLPTDGIYDPGADRETRLQQTSGGMLAINGGGGEIFRNFFHLPDRRFRLLDLVLAFYRGFSPRVFRQAGYMTIYRGRLAMSMAAALGMNGADPLTRLTHEQVELIYPLFRCHHWMAVNNSVSIRHGAYITPLINIESVKICSQLPMSWKAAGRLECRLITQLYPRIATYPSNYGFTFEQGPDWHARFSAWSMRARPIIARPWINAIGRYIHSVQPQAEFIKRSRSLLPGDWILEPWLNLNCLPDNNAVSRALTIELLFRHLL